MTNTTNVNIRMDKELKEEFDAFCKEVGMSVTTAFCLFAKKTVSEGRIPFEISVPVPDARTRKAMAEIDDMERHPENHKGFADVDEMFEEILK